MFSIDTRLIPDTSIIEVCIEGVRNSYNSWEKSDNSGKKDMDLLKKLSESGSSHRKFLRIMQVYADIVAPLYWWKEYDTYKVGTVALSGSTMHTIASKPFAESDFSWDESSVSDETKKLVLKILEEQREKYIETKDKKDWRALIQLLPESYDQKRTVMLNYETIRTICAQRVGHRLIEWHTFIEWAKSLPYSFLLF